MIMKTMLQIVEEVERLLPPKDDADEFIYSTAKLLAKMSDEQNRFIVTTAPDVVDAYVKIQGIKRKTSPVWTEECPIEDVVLGGYCESDAQLRDRLKASLQK